MEDTISYFDIATLVVPVLAVFFGGILAFWQLNYQNKQRRVDRWKEEFREYIADYVEISSNLGTLAILKPKKHEDTVDKLKNVLNLVHQLRKIATKIDLLFNENDSFRNELMNCINDELDYFTKVENGEKVEKFTKDIVVIAKKIHNNHKG